MLKKLVLPILLCILAFYVSACEPPDNETICKIIKSATAVAFDRIIDNNPELGDSFYAFAKMNKKIMAENEVDTVAANDLMRGVLKDCQGLDEDGRTIILSLFNTIVPLIELPPEGVIKEPQRMFLISFYDGIIMAVETRKELLLMEEGQ